MTLLYHILINNNLNFIYTYINIISHFRLAPEVVQAQWEPALQHPVANLGGNNLACTERLKH